MGVPFGRAIRYIFFVAEKATKKDTAPITNAQREAQRSRGSKLQRFLASKFNSP